MHYALVQVRTLAVNTAVSRHAVTVAVETRAAILTRTNFSAAVQCEAVIGITGRRIAVVTLTRA